MVSVLSAAIGEVSTAGKLCAVSWSV